MIFKIYSKENCNACKMTELMLAPLGETVVFKLDADFTMDELLERFPDVRTFPQVMVDDKHLGGMIDVVGFIDNIKSV